MLREIKYINWAVEISFFAGRISIAVFFLLSVLSLFGTGNYAGYIARFLFLGLAYLLAGWGFKKRKPWAFSWALLTSCMSCVVLIVHYTFVTAQPANSTIIFSRIFWHLPLVVIYFLSAKELYGNS
ncbi:MAG TPA: hypothetical protein PL155_01765 [Candidatus Omnitrophota bacterium]|nr:hypothetical protein [Candidatus Omnitrophota bacterium]HPD84786.1 hypothetical protein [Candidatus Omnitrophota bacterium]HRZ03644.1 hypothetical protein [Candidatus Omnitrophota bacterium]